MEIIKILAVCIITAALAVILKQQRAEYALIVSLAAGAVILIYIISEIYSPLMALKAKLDSTGSDYSLFSVPLKALGIGYITNFIADSCRDCGETSLASKAEFAGKCSIFILSVPLIINIIETALSFI